MTIGQYEFTSVKYHSGASTANVILEFTDDKIQIFRGSGVKRVFLPPAKESNSYGEIFIVNDQTAANNIVVDGNGANGSGANEVSDKGKTTDGEDVTLSQNNSAHFRYVPQRVKYDQYGNSVSEGSWIAIQSA